jgi:hypothetical protein
MARRSGARPPQQGQPEEHAADGLIGERRAVDDRQVLLLLAPKGSPQPWLPCIAQLRIVRRIIAMVERRRREGEIVLSRERARELAATVEVAAQRLIAALTEVEQEYARSPGLKSFASGDLGLLDAGVSAEQLRQFKERGRYWVKRIPKSRGAISLADVLGVADARLLCMTGAAVLYGELRRQKFGRSTPPGATMDLPTWHETQSREVPKLKLPSEKNTKVWEAAEALWIGAHGQPWQEHELDKWKWQLRRMRGGAAQLQSVLMARLEVGEIIRDEIWEEHRQAQHRRIRDDVRRSTQ